MGRKKGGGKKGGPPPDQQGAQKPQDQQQQEPQHQQPHQQPQQPHHQQPQQPHHQEPQQQQAQGKYQHHPQELQGHLGGHIPSLGGGSEHFPDLGGGSGHGGFQGEMSRGRGRGLKRGQGRGQGQEHREFPQQAYTTPPMQPPAPSSAGTLSPPGSVYSGDGSQDRRGGGRGGHRGRGQGTQDNREPPRQEYRSPEPVQAPQPVQISSFPTQTSSSGEMSRGRGRGLKRGQGRGQGQEHREFPQQAYTTPPIQPPAPSSVEQSTSNLAGLQISNGKKRLWNIPERKIRCDKNGMVGVRGRKIEIEVNHLLLTLKKQKPAYHYDCAFKPDVPKKMLRMAIEQMRLRHYPNRYPAFDGRKNLYSSGVLPFGDSIRDNVQVADEERQGTKEFDVTIKKVSMVDMDQIAHYLSNGVGFPQDAIQALDIVLRNPSAIRFTPVGRSYFTRPVNEILSLGNGLELWYGFYQSAVLGWRPFLNVDVAHKGFPEAKSLLEVMIDIKAKNGRRDAPRPTMQELSQRGLQSNELEDFNKFIRGLKVEYMIPNQPNTRRVYKMNGTRQPCIEHRFTLDDGRTITIGQYFEQEKRYRLQFPRLPCIHVGSMERDVCLPPELCKVLPGQVTMKKLDETQTAAMVKAAARPADERKRRIMEAMKNAGFTNDPCINEFGVTINQQFEKVKARVLDPPNLEYRGNNRVKVSKGVWRAGTFLLSSNLDKWVVLSLSQRGNERQLCDFAYTLSQMGKQVGMIIEQPYKCLPLSEKHDLRRVNGNELQKILLPYFVTFKNEGAQLVVVVIPDRPPDTYSKVKLAAEVNVGLLTQCIKERTMNKMNPATAGNILLKLNAKLNGINHTVDKSFCPSLMDAPTMLVGADVTHPSPDQKTIPSVAAVAASHDRRAFQYNMIWKLQPPREEIILHLEEIMKEQLMFFYRKTRQKPLKIIFYRDGVSEGQFSQVLEREMSAIRRACTSLNTDYQPRVTFLVVQKRHHTRFFPTRKEDEDGRNKNVPPGTIVDTMITHPKEMDFYLVSHASLQGTSRPTKYHKLWDENDIGEDDLEELTYYLCHLFSRCTRSVSYPAPTYYAHLAAARGRVYLEGSKVNLTNLPQEMTNRTIQDAIVKGSPMFFV